MKSNDTRHWTSNRGAWALLGFLFLFACSGDGAGCESGCDCASSVPYPETAPAVENGVQVRVSQHGFDFVENNLDAIIGQFMEGGLTFCIPEDPAQPLCNVRTCPSTGETGCELSLEMTNVQIDTTAPARVQIDLMISGMNPDEDFIEVSLDPLGTGLADCIVRLNANGSGLPAHVYIDFLVDPVTGDITLELDPESFVIEFEQLDPQFDWQDPEDIIGCGGIGLLANIGFVQDLIFGTVEGMLGDFIGPATTGLLCQQCVDSSGCPAGNECVDIEGNMVCYDAAQSKCVPTRLGIETLMDMGALMASVSPGLEAELYVQAKAHSMAEAVEHGLTLGMRGGTYADKAECVPVVPPPAQSQVAASDLLKGNLDGEGNPFHVGVGISKAFLDEALWGVFNSGSLCLSVGPEVSDLISTGTFSALMPSLRNVTHGENGPMLIKLEPALPPTVEIGAGTYDPDTGTIIEPLLTLHWNNLDISFLAFFDERYVKVFTINTDLVVPMAIDPTDEGLVILLGDLTGAFERIEARDSELLAESPETIETLIPALVGVAMPLLGDSLTSPIAIPEFSGFSLEVIGLTGIEGNTMMALFANLSLAPVGGNQNWQPVETQLELVDIHLPPAHLTQPNGTMTEEDRTRRLVASRPVVTLQASASHLGHQLAEGEAQYSYRLNGGMWSTWRRDSTLVLDDHVLLLQGVHKVEVRARLDGVWSTVDPTAATLDVPIDFEDPMLELMQHGNLLSLVGTDVATKGTDLVYSIRVNGGPWTEWSRKDEIDLDELAPSGTSMADVEARVRDSAGRMAFDRRTLPLQRREPPRSTSDGGCGCVTAPSGGPTSLAWLGLFALVAGLGLARRRRADADPSLRASTVKFLVALFVAMGMIGSGCSCDDDPGAGSPCPEGCEHGKVCIGGVCEHRTDCQSDSDCAVNALCVEGQCFEDACRTDDDCEEGVCAEDTSIGHKRCVSAACSSDAECEASLDCGPRTPFCAESTGTCGCPDPCGDGCSDGTYCCNTTDSCDPLPDPCDATVCEPGFGPSLTSDAVGDSETCEITAGVCDCVELPPLDEGVIGRYGDSIEVGGQIVISAYNDTYGDLMVGFVGAGDTIEWTFVDGVPNEGTVTGSLNGPRAGIADEGINVGRFSSIDADSTGNLMVAYRDDTNRSLKFAMGIPVGAEYSWQIFTLDTAGDTGWFTDVSVGPADVPAVAYMTLREPNADPTIARATSKLRWIQAPSSVPDETGWTGRDLDTAEVDFYCLDACQGSEKCRLDTNTCEAAQSGSNCNDSCGSEEACFAGACAPIAPDVLGSLPLGIGLFASVARYADGSPAVAYYDRVGGDLRFVRMQAGTWAAPLVLDGRNPDGTDSTDAGVFCDLAIDASDHEHITYVDSTRSDLRYLNLADATSEVIDAGIRIEPGKVKDVLVGDDSSIVFDASGNLRIVYQNATDHQVIMARQSGDAWELITLAGDESSYAGSFGFYSNQLWSGSESVITTFKYNRQTDPESSGVAILRF